MPILLLFCRLYAYTQEPAQINLIIKCDIRISFSALDLFIAVILSIYSSITLGWIFWKYAEILCLKYIIHFADIAVINSHIISP